MPCQEMQKLSVNAMVRWTSFIIADIETAAGPFGLRSSLFYRSPEVITAQWILNALFKEDMARSCLPLLAFAWSFLGVMSTWKKKWTRKTDLTATNNRMVHNVNANVHDIMAALWKVTRRIARTDACASWCSCACLHHLCRLTWCQLSYQ